MGQRRAENGANVGETCGLQQRGRLKKKKGGGGGKWDKEVSGVSAQGDSAKKGTMLVVAAAQWGLR